MPATTRRRAVPRAPRLPPLRLLPPRLLLLLPTGLAPAACAPPERRALPVDVPPAGAPRASPALLGEWAAFDPSTGRDGLPPLTLRLRAAADTLVGEAALSGRRFRVTGDATPAALRLILHPDDAGPPYFLDAAAAPGGHLAATLANVYSSGPPVALALRRAGRAGPPGAGPR